MGVRFRCSHLHSLAKLSKARVTRQVRSQRHTYVRQIGEVDAVGRGVVYADIAYENVNLPCVTVKQGLECCQKDHMNGDPLPAAKSLRRLTYVLGED